MREAALTILRHGESNWNAVGRQQGQLDSGLSERGVAQARAAAARLATGSFDAVYTSDLGRALQTAEIVAEATGHVVIDDERLRERNMGIFQGHTWPEIQDLFPDEYAAFNTGDPDYVIPGGESARQRYERTVGALEDVALRHLGDSIIVVSHGGVLNGLFRHALGLGLTGPRRYRLWNASLNVFSCDENRVWTLGTWGDVSHLAALGTLDDA